MGDQCVQKCEDSTFFYSYSLNTTWDDDSVLTLVQLGCLRSWVQDWSWLAAMGEYRQSFQAVDWTSRTFFRSFLNEPEYLVSAAMCSERVAQGIQKSSGRS